MKAIKYRGYKITKKGECYIIHWSSNKTSISSANTLEDAEWIIDQELQEDAE